jgi:hypothetical protein
MPGRVFVGVLVAMGCFRFIDSYFSPKTPVVEKTNSDKNKNIDKGLEMSYIEYQSRY